MRKMLLIESAGDGVLFVNGQFMGPMEREGQAFPCGRNEEIYIQLFPFGECVPLTARLILQDGQITVLEPQENCFVLLWPGGIVQLELHMQGREHETAQERAIAPNILLQYLNMRLMGDAQAQMLLIRQDGRGVPDLSEYHAAVPLRFMPQEADGRFDIQAGLVRRIAPNIACVDAAHAMTVPLGQGRCRIERIEIVRT